MASVTAAVPPVSQQMPSDYNHKQDHPYQNINNNNQSHQSDPSQPPLSQQYNNAQIQQPAPPQLPSNSFPNFKPYLDTTPDSPASNVDTSGASHYEHDMYAGQQQSPDDSAFTGFAAPDSAFGQTTRGINLRYQLFLDRITPHSKARWAFSLTALFVFMARVVIAQGWYVVCYALAIYYLNLFIGFITPKIDPSLNFSEDEDGPMLPTHASDEFRPFIRRLPEFKFWLSATQATLLSLFLTLFEIFDIPVFWPILLLYFIILTACTMRQQIKHMIKWKYVPWDAGKKRYTGKATEGGSDFDPTTV